MMGGDPGLARLLKQSQLPVHWVRNKLQPDIVIRIRARSADEILARYPALEVFEPDARLLAQPAGTMPVFDLDSVPDETLR